MTPAVRQLKAAGIAHRVHRFDAAPGDSGYGLAAAAALGVDPARVFKTLMATNGRDFAIGIVPANGSLSLKRLAAALGWKKASMADPADAERLSGYLVGGISPLGQKKRLPTLMDASAEQWPTIYVSGGQRGLDIEVAPQALLHLGVTQASVADA